MALNEHTRTRSRWPVRFDIEGVPRDHRVREQKLEEENMRASAVKQKNEHDFSKPVIVPYQHQDFPRRIFRGKQAMTVHTQEELEKQLAQGWHLTAGEARQAAPGLTDTDNESAENAKPAATGDDEEENEQQSDVPESAEAAPRRKKRS